MADSPVIRSGACIGVIGGGQLGRYFALAARRLGYLPWVLDPSPDAPAMPIAERRLVAAYDDDDALERLAAGCAAVTIEFENVPAEALSRLETRVRTVPSAASVRIAQDRRREKAAAAAAGLTPVPHAALSGPSELDEAARIAGFPAILKTATLGYDGLGQRHVADRAALDDAWRALGGAPAVLERRIELQAELSVVLARSDAGTVVTLPVARNRHVDGILTRSSVPCGLDVSIEARAIEQATALADALEHRGVLAVEFFLDRDGGLWFNEMAPRPHNSGHFSLDATDLSQFELQVRTLCALPLTAPRLLSPVVMINLLGGLWANGEPAFDAPLALPGTALHLYGKARARAGRKMGHVNCLAADAHASEALADRVERALATNPGESDPSASD